MNAHNLPTTAADKVVQPRPIVRRGEDGKPVTNSRDVASYFRKEHKHVLRDIDALISQAPEARSNFGQGSYTLPSTGSQQHRCFDMDRDGFTLLAMGFTGAKALQFKLSYIAEFNVMEAELAARNSAAPVTPQLPDFTDPAAAAIAWAAEYREKAAAQKALAIAEPKAEALDALTPT